MLLMQGNSLLLQMTFDDMPDFPEYRESGKERTGDVADWGYVASSHRNQNDEEHDDRQQRGGIEAQRLDRK